MTNEESPVDPIAPAIDSPQDADAAAQVSAEKAPARRRAAAPRSRKKVEEPVAEPAASPEAADAPPVVDESAPLAEKPAPRRRPTTRKTVAKVEEPVAEPVVEVPAPESNVAEPVVEANVAAEVVDEAPKPARRGSRTRASAAKAPVVQKRETGEELTPEEQVLADILSMPQISGKPEPQPSEAPIIEASAEADAPAEARPTSRSRNRRGSGRGGRGKKEETPEVAADVVADAPVEEAPAEVEVRPVPQARPAPSRQTPRSRGQRGRVAESVEVPLDGARVVVRNGFPEIVVKGETIPPVLFFGNVDGMKESRKVVSEVQRAARSGVRIHSTLIDLTCPLPPNDTVYETLDNRLQLLFNADPQGFLLPRIVFAPAPGWRAQYPNEVNHYADGSTDDPSIASDRFWQEAELSLKALIEHIQRSNFGSRVIGYHLERGEWFHPVDDGYDRSYANREAFRQWLRNKYNNSEVSLRAAWYDGTVQFYTAEIPALPTNGRPEVAFFEPRRDRQQIDFLEYTSEITAERLIGLAKVVKDVSQNRALVSVCYGYSFEFGHTFSGHLALGKVLESPTIDLVAGPPSYRTRQAGGAGLYPAPIDSVRLHGKIWLSEDDTKTHLAAESADDFNPRCDTKFFTEQVHARAMGMAGVHQTAVGWMDLWGEGWLDDSEIWSRIGTFVERQTAHRKVHKAVSPEVVVLLDERSLLHLQRGDAFLRRILQQQRETLQRSGASIGYYLQSDITEKNFPLDAKLYLFLTPYRLSAAEREAIKSKLQAGGKTLVFMYAPGHCDARGEPEEGVHDILGITLRQQSWNSEIGSRITNTRHPITDKAQDRTVGARERVNPSFYVDDDTAGIVVLGEYQQSGLPSIAVRKFSDWTSVFCGEPTLTADLLRGLCKAAGVHLYTAPGDDFVFAGNGFLVLHTVRDGHRTIFVPKGHSLYDLSASRLLGENITEYRTFLRGKNTRLFYVATIEEMRKLGLDGTEKGRPRRSPDSEASTVVVEIPAEDDGVVPDVIPDLEEAIVQFEEARAEATADAEEMEAIAVEPTEDAEAAERRRRRRRGGRGRGRRPRSGPRAPGEAGGDPPASGGAE